MRAGRTLRPRSTRSSWSRNRVSRRCSTTTRTSAVPDSSDSWRPGPRPEAWAAAEAVELGDAVDGSYEIETLELDRLVVRRDASVSIGADGAGATVRVVKTFTLGGDRRSPTLAETVEVTNRSDVTVEAILGLEWTLTMLGGGGNPSAWLEVDGERTSHDSPRAATAQTRLSQGNDYIGIAITSEVSPAAEIWCAPVETISNSEAGFERVYQGEGLLLGWPLSLAGGRLADGHRAPCRGDLAGPRGGGARGGEAGDRPGHRGLTSLVRGHSADRLLAGDSAGSSKSGARPGIRRPADRRPCLIHARAERGYGRSRDRRRPYGRPYPEIAAGSSRKAG